MRSSHCARGKGSAGAAYFLNPLATAPVAQSSEIRAAAEPALQAVSLRETCRQLVEQAGDSAARRHRNHAENVLRAELGMLAAVTTEVIAHLAFCAGWPSAMWAAQTNLMPIEIGKS
jgi:alkylhydroperoxidase/carboxymuconolactone decarboxylase family protein YurZ